MPAEASKAEPAQSSGARLAAGYRWLATTLLTTLLLFAAANAIAAVLLAAGVGVPAPGPLRHGLEPLRASYPERTDAEIRQLLTEVWTRPYIYEPFTEFREGAFAGRFLNILPEGFRSAGHAQPWPPSPDERLVFVFGGSTAMGYGVADHETLPAQLEVALSGASCGPAVVYNFARSSYFSSQERILFQQLALEGYVPNVAVFVDGLNEFAYPTGEPKFASRMGYLMGESQAQLARRWLVHLPLARLLKGLRGGEDGGGATHADTVERAEEVVHRWLRNRRLVAAAARELGVGTLFVWQPVPAYPPGADDGPAASGPPDPVPSQEALVAGFRSLEKRVRRADAALGDDFLWLADLASGASEPPYVDRVHYSPSFTATLARALAPAVADRLCRGAVTQAAPPAP